MDELVFVSTGQVIDFLFFILFLGAIGYLSCLYFLRKIFASIKVD
jgi:hypothetical protein